MRSFHPYQPAGSTPPEATPLLDPVQGKGQGMQWWSAATAIWHQLVAVTAVSKGTTCSHPHFPAPGSMLLLLPVVSRPFGEPGLPSKTAEN